MIYSWLWASLNSHFCCDKLAAKKSLCKMANCFPTAKKQKKQKKQKRKTKKKQKRKTKKKQILVGKKVKRRKENQISRRHCSKNDIKYSRAVIGCESMQTEQLKMETLHILFCFVCYFFCVRRFIYGRKEEHSDVVRVCVAAVKSTLCNMIPMNWKWLKKTTKNLYRKRLRTFNAHHFSIMFDNRIEKKNPEESVKKNHHLLLACCCIEHGFLVHFVCGYLYCYSFRCCFDSSDQNR